MALKPCAPFALCWLFGLCPYLAFGPLWPLGFDAFTLWCSALGSFGPSGPLGPLALLPFCPLAFALSVWAFAPLALLAFWLFGPWPFSLFVASTLGLLSLVWSVTLWPSSLGLSLQVRFCLEGSLSLLTLLFAPGLVSLGVSCSHLPSLCLSRQDHAIDSCSIRLLEGPEGRRPEAKAGGLFWFCCGSLVAAVNGRHASSSSASRRRSLADGDLTCRSGLLSLQSLFCTHSTWRRSRCIIKRPGGGASLAL